MPSILTKGDFTRVVCPWGVLTGGFVLGVCPVYVQLASFGLATGLYRIMQMHYEELYKAAEIP